MSFLPYQNNTSLFDHKYADQVAMSWAKYIADFYFLCLIRNVIYSISDFVHKSSENLDIYCVKPLYEYQYLPDEFGDFLDKIIAKLVFTLYIAISNLNYCVFLVLNQILLFISDVILSILIVIMIIIKCVSIIIFNVE
jgi:hypothetical protein